jgi:hypothetical protein
MEPQYRDEWSNLIARPHQGGAEIIFPKAVTFGELLYYVEREQLSTHGFTAP